ncbi:MAG: hypothetical protein IIY53_08785 [Solobacterium sp.]|nr:hypothetical protein [Solobacterium sp.]MBQ1321718.1 hypothetical protein [Solobacterium sp.]
MAKDKKDEKNGKNKVDPTLDTEDMEKIVKYIGKVYRRSKKRRDVFEYQKCIRENQALYDNDGSLIMLIDRTLMDCSKETQCIIRNEFLEIPEDMWYLPFFSRSAYYRLRKKALVEFMNCLKI